LAALAGLDWVYNQEVGADSKGVVLAALALAPAMARLASHRTILMLTVAGVGEHAPVELVELIVLNGLPGQSSAQRKRRCE
jgi:hypothetical protein